MDQVFINLFKNAMEALIGTPGALISITGQTSDNQTVIEFTDNGPGITDYAMQHLFVPFFTTKEGGSGIGLHLSRQLVRLHGGTLNVQSVPGKTSFTIRLS